MGAVVNLDEPPTPMDHLTETVAGGLCKGSSHLSLSDMDVVLVCMIRIVYLFCLCKNLKYLKVI